MKDFFPIETPYSSEDYKIMKDVVNQGIDSSLEGFTKSEFKKSPDWSNKFLWNIHVSELPILYRRLQELYDKTGNEDYLSLLDDIRSVADTSKAAIAAGEYGEEELEEMIDPNDPMDANQTITGEPTATSDLSRGGVDTAPAYAQGPVTDVNAGIENYIDDDTKSQELAKESLGTLGLSYTNESHNEKDNFTPDYKLINQDVVITNETDEHGKFGETGKVTSLIEPTPKQKAGGYKIIAYVVQFPDSPEEYTYIRSEFEKAGEHVDENSSDSLMNQHGMNAKPETIDEITDTERYERVVFLQGEEASEAMDILNNEGKDAAMEYLKQWHYPGEHMGSTELGHGSLDKTYEKDGYIMAWNPYLSYIGLVYDTEHNIDEDSQMMRHRAGQRGKIGNMPLGQHAPHSQAAMKENKNNGTTSK